MSDLRFERTQLLAKPPKHGGVGLTRLVVGETAVALGVSLFAEKGDSHRIAVLDRRDLTVQWMHDIDSATPMAWIDADRLLIWGRSAAVLRVSDRRVSWSAPSTTVPVRWRDLELTWPSDSTIEARTVDTGEVVHSLDLGVDAAGRSIVHGDLLIGSSPTKADHVRAVHLFDGEIVWERDLIAQFRAQRPPINPLLRQTIWMPTPQPTRIIAWRATAAFGCSAVDGSIVWLADLYAMYAPPIHHGRLLVLSAAVKQRFMVVDVDTGETVYERSYEALAPMWKERNGAILGDMVVFVSESGHVAAFDITNGDLLFLECYRVPFVAITTLDDDRLVATANDGQLWIFRRER